MEKNREISRKLSRKTVLEELHKRLQKYDLIDNHIQVPEGIRFEKIASRDVDVRAMVSTE